MVNVYVVTAVDCDFSNLGDRNDHQDDALNAGTVYGSLESAADSVIADVRESLTELNEGLSEDDEDWIDVEAALAGEWDVQTRTLADGTVLRWMERTFEEDGYTYRITERQINA